MPSFTEMDVLKARHAELEELIQQEDQRPRPDSDVLIKLKVEKLHVKEKMENLGGLVH